MQPVWIAVAILFAIGLTVLMCVTFLGSYYAIVQMRKMQQSADLSAKAINEMLGEGSITRAARSLSNLAEQMPEAVITLRAFNKTMAQFTKAMFVEQSPQPAKVVVTEESESAFIPYSEEGAAMHEVIREAQKNKLNLTDEQLATMRTDNGPLNKEAV
jgi:hypothetical protein